MTTAAPLSLGFVWRVGREATRHTEESWNPPCGTLPVEPSLFAIWSIGVTHIRLSNVLIYLMLTPRRWLSVSFQVPMLFNVQQRVSAALL
jgi:hypothetical protein